MIKICEYGKQIFQHGLRRVVKGERDKFACFVDSGNIYVRNVPYVLLGRGRALRRQLGGENNRLISIYGKAVFLWGRTGGKEKRAKKKDGKSLFTKRIHIVTMGNFLLFYDFWAIFSKRMA